jgi:histidinol phosphatase-like PHP family hydrolase
VEPGYDLISLGLPIKIDLHVHAKERSACAQAGEEEMIRAAMKRGLDGLVFTDHGRLVPPRRLAELSERFAPFAVFGGIEIRVSGEDVLVLGIQDPVLESRKWTYPELHAFVSRHRGFLVLAHPFRYRDRVNIDIETYRPDALELRSTNIKTEAETHILALAERLGLRLVCNSDAHRAADVGCYYNRLAHRPQDGEELTLVLKAGKYQCDGGA